MRIRWLAAALATVLCPGNPLAQSDERWNVLLITVDTLRADRLSSYGYEQGSTQAFQRLAQRGAVFEHAIAPTPLTLPSHASLLASAYPFHHGLLDNAGFVLPQDYVTLAESLAAAGYATGAFVGAFVLDSRTGLAQGFERYFDDFDLSGRRFISADIQRRAGEVADPTMAWIKRQAAGQRPFFAWAHFYDPHAPYEPPAPFDSRFSDRLYDGEIAYVDSVLSGIWDFLAREGLEDKTMVVVTSDHGEGLGQHGEKTHGFFIYECTQHVPLIWSTPDGRLSGRRIKEAVQLVDVAPTILRLLGLPVPQTMQGRSLVRLLTGRGDRSAQPPAYAETHYPRLHFGWHPLRAIYRAPYKYIDAPIPELYNLQEDPGEESNLYPKQRSLGDSLRDLLNRTATRYSSDKKRPEASTPIDPEQAQALAALGYASASAGFASLEDYSDLPDPKQKLEIHQMTERAFDLQREGKMEQASAQLRRVLAKDPSARFVHQHLGSVLAQLGRHEEAVASFSEAARSFPANSILHFNLGLSYLRLRRWPDAAQAFRKTLEIDPNHFRARSNLASLQLQQGRPREALQQALKVLQSQPRYEPALFNAGVASLAMGNRDQAILYLEKVIEINPANRHARRFLDQARSRR